MLFSIIIPSCVNHKTFYYFKNCIRSILKQSLDQSFFEVIIIDNGSKKNLKPFFRNLEGKIRNSKFILFKKKIGPGIARNYGIKKAKGKFLIFLDSDDLLPKYCLRDYYRIIKKKKLDIITSNWRYKNSKKSQRKDFKYLKIGKLDFVKKFISMNFDSSIIFTVIRKKIFTANKISFPKGLHEDIIVIFKIYFFSKSIQTYNKIMYLKRNNKYSIMNSFDEERIVGYLSSWMRIKKFLVNRFGKKYFYKYFNNFFIKGIYGLIAIMILENKKINKFSQKKIKLIKKIKNLTKKKFYLDLKNNPLRNTTYYDKIAKEFITKNILFNKNTNIGINSRLNK